MSQSNEHQPPSHLHRHSIRLKDYDYTRPAFYFVTLSTHNREHLFGNVVDAKMNLSYLGTVVSEEWVRTGSIRAEIELDEWIVMPNHLHGIIHIRPSAHSVKDYEIASNDRLDFFNEPIRSNFSRRPRSLSSLISGFKSAVTSRIQKMDSSIEVVWLRNYYEHIIRNEKSLNVIRLYIQLNPVMWEHGVDDFDISSLTPEEIDKRLAKFRT